MLIWRGFGFLVFLIVFGCSLVVDLIVGGDEAYNSNPFYLAGALALAAVIIYFVDMWLDKRAEANKRELTDDKTGQKLVLKQRNTLFFIDMKWWPYIVAGFAVTSLFIKHS